MRCWNRQTASFQAKSRDFTLSKKNHTELTNQFPRRKTLPSQSSKYWAKEKDRYLRQLLISDIENGTGRDVVVYYDCDLEGILRDDADDIAEIIEGVNRDKIDIVLHTPGGSVDAVEKVVTVLKQAKKAYRVIVPSFAKSGGTVIAMSAEQILMGVNSELGPIDPQFFLKDIGAPVPCQIIAADQSLKPTLRSLASAAVRRMNSLATKILKEGMLSGATESDLSAVIAKLSSSNTYNSHGAVIDFTEAKSLGLSVEWMEPNEDLWRRVWLLHCCYDHDAKLRRIGKIIEGANNSITRPSRKK